MRSNLPRHRFAREFASGRVGREGRSRKRRMRRRRPTQKEAGEARYLRGAPLALSLSLSLFVSAKLNSLRRVFTLRRYNPFDSLPFFPSIHPSVHQTLYSLGAIIGGIVINPIVSAQTCACDCLLRLIKKCSSWKTESMTATHSPSPYSVCLPSLYPSFIPSSSPLPTHIQCDTEGVISQAARCPSSAITFSPSAIRRRRRRRKTQHSSERGRNICRLSAPSSLLPGKDSANGFFRS